MNPIASFTIVSVLLVGSSFILADRYRRKYVRAMNNLAQSARNCSAWRARALRAERLYQDELDSGEDWKRG